MLVKLPTLLPASSAGGASLYRCALASVQIKKAPDGRFENWWVVRPQGSAQQTAPLQHLCVQIDDLYPQMYHQMHALAL
jgi:hypothetical protein